MSHLLDEPHHDPSPTYSAAHSAALGDEVPVRVRVPRARGAQAVVLRAVCDGEPVIRAARRDGGDAWSDWWTVDVPVANPVAQYRFLLHGAGGSYAWLNGTGAHPRDVTDAADFRILAQQPPAPEWVQDAVVYQVFPDRFARSGEQRAAPGWAVAAGWDDEVVHSGPLTGRQWFGGDLRGVEERLDHLVSLGVDVLYLTPFFEGRSNHRYDAVSFDRVDPVLGGDEALVALTRTAHARGLRVLGDLTTNHTGVGHEWFAAATADAGSPEAGFYRFRDHPHDYASWLGVPSLPKLDHGAPGLGERLAGGPDSVVARWLRPPFSLDGWRIDVANMTGRLDADDRAHEVARRMRATAAAHNPQAWLLAEHGHDASADLAAGGWHGTMNYAGFTRPVWTWLTTPGHGLGMLGLPLEVPSLPGTAIVATMREVTAAMPWAALVQSATLLGSHDTARIRTVVGSRERHLAALALLATMPGAPMVFAGDEIGLTGTDGEHSRTPFPWDRPDAWDLPTLAAYRELLALRRQSVALRRGGLRWVHAGADSLTFLREHPQGSVLVHVARADHPPVRLPLAGLAPGSATAGGGPGGDSGWQGRTQGFHMPETLYGEPPVREDADTVSLPGRGPAAHVYDLGPSS